MYISNGIDINPLWYDHIAWSTNGRIWNTIQKDGLSVDLTKTKKVYGALTNSELQWTVNIKHQGEERIAFKLPVSNQPTWTNTHSGAAQAVADINAWTSVDSISLSVQLLQSISDQLSDNKTQPIRRTTKQILSDIDMKMNTQLQQNQIMIYLLQGLNE
jgi:hypothetical protein